MTSRLGPPALLRGRRRSLSLAVAALVILGVGATHAQERRWVVAFANLSEEPGVTLEATGFTGADVRRSLELAARRYPIDLVFYDNGRDGRRALANVEDAVARKVDLYIQYQRDAAVNAAVAERLRAAGIRAIAVNYPMPGAPLYTADNTAAGRIAGEALGTFAARSWRGQPTVGVVIGALTAQAERVPERAQGVVDGLRRTLPAARVTPLDTHGNPAQVAPLLGRVLAASPTAKILVAALDDATALAAKSALEAAGRTPDAAIVSHGADRSMHGGINDRKEIDPTNRGSIILGSVAFYLDRYGDEVLPLVMRMLRGEPIAARTVTPHRLISAANVWVEYPPSDMN
ncbi:MAG TPA: sugar ABC transporter substrate-binding protein [Methylomirabilota bacterium]|nr:sugar ABC transporter substrate-binding protein [Methylomirabilota bacterium]